MAHDNSPYFTWLELEQLLAKAQIYQQGCRCCSQCLDSTCRRMLVYRRQKIIQHFRAGMVESWGRGVERIMQACKDAGISAPELRYEQN